MSYPHPLFLLPISLLFITAGCQNNTQQELTTLRDQNKKLNSELNDTRQMVVELEKQIVKGPATIASPHDLTLKTRFDLYRFPPDYDFATPVKTNSENEQPILHFSTVLLETNSIFPQLYGPEIQLWLPPRGDLIDDHPKRK